MESCSVSHSQRARLPSQNRLNLHQQTAEPRHCSSWIALRCGRVLSRTSSDISGNATSLPHQGSAKGYEQRDRNSQSPTVLCREVHESEEDSGKYPWGDAGKTWSTGTTTYCRYQVLWRWCGHCSICHHGLSDLQLPWPFRKRHFC
jgi:hypothetical protein